MMIYLTAIG